LLHLPSPGVILVRPDSSLKTIHDLADSSIIMPTDMATGTFLAQWSVMAAYGIHPLADTSQVPPLPRHISVFAHSTR
jgi:ABC-type nitrate/sulfonate/bicarbonate transport system substrate-binding protein